MKDNLFTQEWLDSRSQLHKVRENKKAESLPDNNFVVHIKPMSINEYYTGRRFKTKESREYTQKVLAMLPSKIEMPSPPYQIYFKFGLSSKASDWDNGIKVAQDLLATKYGFNDKLIRKGVVETEIVPKGKEYFIFKIEHYQTK